MKFRTTLVLLLVTLLAACAPAETAVPVADSARQVATEAPVKNVGTLKICLLYTSPSPRD